LRHLAKSVIFNQQNQTEGLWEQ